MGCETKAFMKINLDPYERIQCSSKYFLVQLVEMNENGQLFPYRNISNVLEESFPEN